jgi:protein SCO1
MTPRTHRVLALLAAALCFVVSGCAAPASAPQVAGAKASALPVTGSPSAPTTPVTDKPDFSLTDNHGGTFDFVQGTRGRVTLLYFGYTHCPDQCPTTMASLAEAVRGLKPADRSAVRVVFVTTDPARDNPKRLGSWLGQFDPTFVGLTGTAQELVAVQEEVLGLPAETVEVGPASIGHAVGVIAYDRTGVERTTFSPAAHPSDYLAGLRRLLGEA